MYLPFDLDHHKHQVTAAASAGYLWTPPSQADGHLVVMDMNSQTQLEAPSSCTPSALDSPVTRVLTSLTLQQTVNSERLPFPAPNTGWALSKRLMNE